MSFPLTRSQEVPREVVEKGLFLNQSGCSASPQRAGLFSVLHRCLVG